MQNIWAIARNTIAQAFCMKAALVLVVAFLAGTTALPFFLEKDPTGHIIISDGTALGGIRVLLTWSVTFATALLTVLTILLSAFVLDDEVRRKQIFMVASKPVSRFSIIAGKWLGIAILNAWLLLLMGVIAHVQLAWFSRPTERATFFQQEIKDQILTSRKSVRPNLPTLEEAMRRFCERVKADKSIPDQELQTRSVMIQIKRLVEQKSIRVEPLGMMSFMLENVPVPERSDMMYTLRYTLHAIEGGKPFLRGRWLISSSDYSRRYPYETFAKGGDSREFTFPAAVVGKDGKLLIQFQNVSIGNPEATVERYRKSYAVSFAIPDGLEVLAGKGAFLPNFFRGLSLIWMRMALLAAIGVAASTVMGYPVTVLLLIMVMAYGYGRDFITIHYEKTASAPGTSMSLSDLKAGQVAQDVGGLLLGKGAAISREIVLLIAPAFSRFDDTDPVSDLVAGREITWSRLIWTAFWCVLIRGGLALLLGWLVFRSVEVGIPRT